MLLWATRGSDSGIWLCASTYWRKYSEKQILQYRSNIWTNFYVVSKFS